MPFNHDIRHTAPFPNGALPTDIELSALRQRAHEAQAEAIKRVFKRIVRITRH